MSDIHERHNALLSMGQLVLQTCICQTADNVLEIEFGRGKPKPLMLRILTDTDGSIYLLTTIGKDDELQERILNINDYRNDL